VVVGRSSLLALALALVVASPDCMGLGGRIGLEDIVAVVVGHRSSRLDLVEVVGRGRSGSRHSGRVRWEDSKARRLDEFGEGRWVVGPKELRICCARSCWTCS